MLKSTHTADIHLASLPQGLEQYEGAPVDETMIRNAAQRSPEKPQIPQTCLSNASW